MIAKQTLTGWLTTDKVIDLTTTIAAALGVLFVTITGIILSYDALWDLARAAGSINPALTWPSLSCLCCLTPRTPALTSCY